MRFHPLVIVSSAVLALGLGFNRLQAQTATQTVRFSLVPITHAAVSGPAGPLVVKTAVAGSALTSASMGGTSYAITTNELNQKISAALDEPMPSGASLAVALAAPAGAASTGSMTLGTDSSDVVTGISAVSAAALPIVYTLTATATAPVAPGTRRVTFTIVAGQ